LGNLIETGAAYLLTDDENARARLVVFHNPVAFERGTTKAGKIRAEKSILVLNHSVADADGNVNYDLCAATDYCTERVHIEPTIAPVSPVNRENLLGSGIEVKNILPDDWTHIVSSGKTQIDRVVRTDTDPVIGRHGRPGPEKWPASRADLFTAYPVRDDIVVRMLGLGPRLLELVGKIPKNWDLFEFNDLDVQRFLESIDYWVYFHDPSLVEGFGLAAAEAMASGAVAILPKYLEPNFREGAIYSTPDRVLEIVTRFHQDPEEYKRQSSAGRKLIAEEYGERQFLERIQRLIGPPRPRPEWQLTPSDSTGATAAGSEHVISRPAVKTHRADFDIIYVGDFRTCGEESARVADEIELLAQGGARTGVVHLDLPQSTRAPTIRADILEPLTAGCAFIVSPSRTIVETETAVLTNRTLELIETARPIAHIFAKRVLLLCDGIGSGPNWVQELASLHARASGMFGGICFLTTANLELYEQIKSISHRFPVAPKWHPVLLDSLRRWGWKELRSLEQSLDKPVFQLARFGLWRNRESRRSNANCRMVIRRSGRDVV
jgi:hypothetical protein